MAEYSKSYVKPHIRLKNKVKLFMRSPNCTRGFWITVGIAALLCFFYVWPGVSRYTYRGVAGISKTDRLTGKQYIRTQVGRSDTFYWKLVQDNPPKQEKSAVDSLPYAPGYTP
jgi:hypothetical protein